MVDGYLRQGDERLVTEEEGALARELRHLVRGGVGAGIGVTERVSVRVRVRVRIRVGARLSVGARVRTGAAPPG